MAIATDLVQLQENSLLALPHCITSMYRRHRGLALLDLLHGSGNYDKLDKRVGDSSGSGSLMHEQSKAFIGY